MCLSFRKQVHIHGCLPSQVLVAKIIYREMSTTFAGKIQFTNLQFSGRMNK
jgi:hypothetical protein